MLVFIFGWQQDLFPSHFGVHWRQFHELTEVTAYCQNFVDCSLELGNAALTGSLVFSSEGSLHHSSYSGVVSE